MINNNNIFMIEGVITRDTRAYISQEILRYISTGISQECTVVINSNGGVLVEALNIVLLFKKMYRKSHAVLIDDCCSSAAIIAASCDTIKDDHRIGLSLHNPYYGTSGRPAVKANKADFAIDETTGVSPHNVYMIAQSVMALFGDMDKTYQTAILDDNYDVIFAASEVPCIREQVTAEMVEKFVKMLHTFT